jgi:hypothetical protein
LYQEHYARRTTTIMMIELTMVSSVFEKTVSLDLTISETSHVVLVCL